MGDLEERLNGQEPARKETARDFFLDMIPVYGDRKLLGEFNDKNLVIKMIGLKYLVLGGLVSVGWIAYETVQMYQGLVK